jgi:uncharacterized protein (TIGR03000 family)
MPYGTTSYYGPTGQTMSPGTDEGTRQDNRRDRSNRRDGSRDESSLSTEATLVVSLPADAQLTVGGARTRSTSSTRRFISPPLEPGVSYTYTLEARIMRDGQPVTLTKDVHVRAGEETRVMLDFSEASVARK